MTTQNLLLSSMICLGFFACTQIKPPSGSATEIKSQQPIDSTDMTNNFYDNTETYPLIVNELTIDGEISNPGKVDFSKLPVHSVVVKEALLDSTGSDKFIGAYRYDGYSLFDILNDRKIVKANAAEFNPIIDMYVEVENAKSEKVVFSWGEIYYPNNLHRILIATGVSRIVPSKTKELWPVPGESKIVAANDLITERNISLPVKITVRSFPKSFKVTKGISPLISEKVDLYDHGVKKDQIADYPKDVDPLTYNTIFYGRGRGIHSTSPFRGEKLAEILAAVYPIKKENLKQGIMCLTGKDGYRCALSYSEIFNRNDQQEFLIVKSAAGEDGGLFRVFPACDFFSDRAVKALGEIHLGY
jgi:hypothetical protein